MSREKTNAVLEMVDLGLLDPRQVLRAVLFYMDEIEVSDFVSYMSKYGEFSFDEEEEEEDEDHDTLP